MPYYEYQCCECEEIFSIYHSVNANTLETIEKCPGCEKNDSPIKRLISKVNFRVTGPAKNPWTRSGNIDFGDPKKYLKDLKRPKIIRTDDCDTCPDLTKP